MPDLNRYAKVRLLLGLVCVSLSACNTSGLPSAGTVTQPTLVPTFTPAPVAGASATQPDPTLPSVTATVADAPTLTAQVAEPTLEPTEVPPTPPADLVLTEVYSNTSPTGQWVAHTLEGYFTTPPYTPGPEPSTPPPVDVRYWQRTQFVVENVAEGKNWIISDVVEASGFVGMKPSAFEWAPDERSLLVTRQGRADGCGVFDSYQGLARADLATGEVETILPASVQADSLALSTDGRTLAYLDVFSDLPTLHLRDIATGTERTLPFAPSEGFVQLGNLLWSPAEDALLLTVESEACSPAWTTAYQRIDVASGTVTTLAEHQEPRLIATEWGEPNIITLTERNTDQLWQLDVTTGVLTKQ